MTLRFCPSSLKCFSHRCALFVADRTAGKVSLGSTGGQCRKLFFVYGLPAQHFGLFRIVLSSRADANVADSIWPNIAITGHAVVIRTAAALLKFATLDPDLCPFVERQQKGDVAAACAGLVVPITFSQRVFGVPFANSSNMLARIGSSPCAHVGALLGSAMISIGHWFLSNRSMVRGGTGAHTLVSSRLYHALRWGEC